MASSLIKGDMLLKRNAIDPLIEIMQRNGYAVNVIPVKSDFELVRVIITEAKGGFYDD